MVREYAPLLLNAREAAGELNVSERMVWTLIATGELASIRIGTRRLIPRQALEAFIAARVAGTKPTAQTPK